MKFSIIIPIYNVEKYLHQCIDSVLVQNFSDYEIILINDGSPDNCGKICDEYAEKYSQIKVFHKENGGLSNARNHGIEVATGEYLMFLDSDDYWQGDNIFLDLKKIIDNEDNPDIIIHSFTYDNQETQKKETRHFQIFLNKLKNIKKKQDNLESYKTNLLTLEIYESTGWNKIVKKEFIDKYGFRFPLGRLHEDIFWSFDLLKKFKNISFYKSNFYQYRVNRVGSITQEIKPKNVLDIANFILEKFNLANHDFLKIFLLQIYFSLYYRFFLLSKENRNLVKNEIIQCDFLTNDLISKYYKYFGIKGLVIRLLGVKYAFLIKILLKNIKIFLFMKLKFLSIKKEIS